MTTTPDSDTGAKSLPLGLLLLVSFLLAFLPRYLIGDCSPLHHDVAGMLAGVRDWLDGTGGLPFGEIWLYRPMLFLLTGAVCSLTPGELTPEGTLGAVAFVTQLCTGLTGALLALWLRRRLGLGPVVILAAVLCWVCTPVLLLFSPGGLNASPAMLFGFAAFLVADLAAHEKRGPMTAFWVGPLLLLGVLSRETVALLALPCAVTYVHHRRWDLLRSTLFGGLLAVAVWLGLEALWFHPGHALTELLPRSGQAGGKVALLEGGRFAGLLVNLGHALGWGVAGLALGGLLHWKRVSAPRLAPAVWVTLFFVLHLLFFQPAVRFRVLYTLPAVVLCLRALQALSRPWLTAAALVALAGGGVLPSLPTLHALATLPHSHRVRAERMAARAGERDLLLSMGPDLAYSRWLNGSGGRVIAFRDLLDERTRARLVRSNDTQALSRPERLAPLLSSFLVPAVRAAAADGRSIYVVPEPALLSTFLALRRQGLRVETLEVIAPGTSRSQHDPFAWRVGQGEVVSQVPEHLLRLSVP